MGQNQHTIFQHGIGESCIVFLSIFFSACVLSPSEQNEAPFLKLDGKWEFRLASDTMWRTATVPGDVIMDLMHLREIDSPFDETNEQKFQWIENTEWVYRTRFRVPDHLRLTQKPLDFVFEGIDTYATIVVNGDTIGQTENAHRAYRFSAQNLSNELNTLEVWLHSATLRGQAKLNESPWLIPVSNEDQPQGQQTSSISRKPFYHFGWDWAPRLVSSGLWKSVWLCPSNSYQPSEIRMDLIQLEDEQARYHIRMNCRGELPSWNLKGPQDNLPQFDLNQIHDSLWLLTIESPERWWPIGMGSQPLYTLECDINGQFVSERFGIRTIKWLREPDRFGRSFACHVNDQKIFARGANIIPADFFTVRARERIEETLQYAVAANMNMLRIWGGAIYGEDQLYDRCDELGLLIWQDFMFACCMVPGDSSFAKSVEAEARYNVKRLRNHPSMALWCGNNESEKAWTSWGWPKQFGLSVQDSIEIQQAYDAIFDGLLPQIVAEESNQFYWASSPMKDPLHGDDHGLSGDEHAWRVWFDTLDFDYYSNHDGRFASEYGLQSLPNRHTLEEVGIHAFEDEALQFRQRSKMDWLKPGLDGWGMMRIYAKRYAADPAIDRKQSEPLDRWIYLTQLTQAEGLKEAIERHRFSRGKTSGSLYWQLNDVWPTVSWSTVDHAGRWKLAHHAVQHANQSQRILIDRNDTDSLRLFIVNESNRSIQGKVKIESFDWSGQVLHAHQITFKSPAFSEEEWNWGALDTWMTSNRKEALRWTWTTDSGAIIDTGIQRFAKPSELHLPEANVTFKIDGNRIELSTDSFAYGVQLTPNIPGNFSSNGMSLTPKQSVWVQFFPETPGSTLSELTIRHLSQYHVH